MTISTNYSNGDKTNTNFEAIDFETPEQLKEIVKKDWTPSVCIGGRTLEHFVYSDFLFGDIDNDSQDTETYCSIEQFTTIFKEKEFYIITSRNHQLDKTKQRNGISWVSKVCDRYHVIFPLSETCWDIDWLSEEITLLCDTHRFFDSSAKGSTRFYFGHEKTEIYYNPGIKWEYKPLQVPEQENLDTDYSSTSAELESTLDSRILDRLRSAFNMGVFNEYAEWIKCGQALKGSGFTLDDWRIVTNSDVKERDLVNKWNSFKPSKIGKGSLIEYCRRSDPEFLKPGSLRSNTRNDTRTSSNKTDAHKESKKNGSQGSAVGGRQSVDGNKQAIGTTGNKATGPGNNDERKYRPDFSKPMG